MSTVRASTYQDASGGSNAVFSGVASPPNSMGFRNRILNGDCRIDQRNAGASVSKPSPQYVLDRWNCNVTSPSAATVGRSSVAPAGFTNSLFVNVTTGGTIGASINYIQQAIEGFNVADLGFGAASASTITISFWVRSSVTGTFGGSLRNGAANRSYAFTYSISAANTWEQKSLTIVGDTTGTWATDNTTGLNVFFDLGSGAATGTAGAWTAANYIGATGTQTALMTTSGATFYITGVQLEAGTVASPFERRDYGRELIMCQRYYAKMSAAASNTYAAFGSGGLTSSTNTDIYIKYPVAMRASPTFAYGGTLGLSRAGNYYNVTGASGTYAGTDSMMQQIQATSLAGTAGQACVLLANADATCFIALSAEL